MTNVESSIVKAIGFEAGQGLTVELVTGAKYLYKDATEAQYQEFMSSKSKGQYFSKVVRTLASEKVA